MNINQVVILCGGTGSRLGDATSQVPKPMLPVQGVPFLRLLVNELAQLPIKQIILLTGYKSGAIKKEFEGNVVNGVKIVLCEEARPRGTLGALCEHYDKLEDQFLLCNADTVWEYEISELYWAIQNNSGDFSYIFTCSSMSGDRYGNISVEDDIVVSFKEKDRGNDGDTNGGMYLIRKSHIQPDDYDHSKKTDLEQILFQDLAKKRQLKTIPNVIRSFHDFGTQESLTKLDEIVTEKFNRRIIILDRDNTINVDHGYTSSADALVFCDNFIKSLPNLLGAKRYFVVVSNQGGIALGKFTTEQSFDFFNAIKEKLAVKGIFFLDYLICPHHPSVSKCECRKPNIGLLVNWQLYNFIDWSNAIVVGDSILDEDLAKNLSAHYIRANENEPYDGKIKELLNDIN